MQRSKHVSVLSVGLWCAASALLVVGLGCNGSEVGSRNRVDELPAGAFFRTAEMHRPRYEHKAMTLDDGTVLVVGGSDERMFTSIDSCEVFDQKLVVEPEPPSLSGGWINTDFEGDDLRLQRGGRIYHSMSRAAEGNVLIAGGVPDGVLGQAYEQSEHYNRHTRKFTSMTADMVVPRFFQTSVSLTDGEVLYFGGQIGMQMTLVDANFPPNDPRFIQQINTNPGTNIIEVYDSSLPSEDGMGNFMRLRDGNNRDVTLPDRQGRAAHASVRIAGLDQSLGNAGDLFLHAGGYTTLSPMFAPQTKLRRTGDVSLLTTIDVYDGGRKSCFVAPGVFLQFARAHGVMAENLGQFSDLTYDGYRGLSNVIMIAGGSTDSLPTTGRWYCEGFVASYTGFGPGGGVQMMHTEPPSDETIPSVIEGVLGASLDQAFYAEFTNAVDLPIPDVVLGKYFGLEAYLTTGDVINRVHAESAMVRRQVWTKFGQVEVGNMFTGAGGYMFVVMGAQIEIYDAPPVNSGEYFDPNFNIINRFFATMRSPYDLDTMRSYWHIRNGVPLPQRNNPGAHPHPTGCDGAWLVCDGFVAGDGWEGYQLLPPNTMSTDDLRIREMERGRAWHTLNMVPGSDGALGSIDDRALFAGGGMGVLAWGDMPVVPSAILYVPPAPR